MATEPRHTDTDDGTDVEPDRGATAGISRWHKVVGIIAVVMVLVFVILKVAGVGGGFGGHGPGGNGPGQNAPVQRQQQQIGTEDGSDHVPPPWVPDHDGDGQRG